MKGCRIGSSAYLSPLTRETSTLNSTAGPGFCPMKTMPGHPDCTTSEGSARIFTLPLSDDSASLNWANNLLRWGP